ncbi:outer membrane protein with beta-barrel domain [Mariniflexile fucanivorans]|uniref:Outer membrane protein with beta-barrel domain n=1 Tax=Mariniflexile fucanivorans TaxID=264023 RepID=A0A4R1RR73_9FLAO|nr:porin family protein [Mariniflexile fucanivorans]TCL68941.1 outer membrane protein with beta-barrel domain [Mariniflexile fucanivorans]
MKFSYRILLVLLSTHLCYSQKDSISHVDHFYKEDQFYIGITYNLLGKKPKDLSQTGFSSGIHFGMIKDMPLNDARNRAIGIGLGYSLNSFNENLLIDKDNDGNITYTILDDSSIYSKNKYTNQLIELPVEFRWRTSTPTEYKFWRIYTGFKIGYLITSTTKFKGDSGEFKYRNISDFNKLQYGLTLSAGYNTWNLYLYYGLNPIFSKDVIVNGNDIKTNTLKVGLMFYIL